MIENAKIARIFLGYEDHGILTGFLHLEGEGWGQGYGGYNLSVEDELKKWIIGSLTTFEVSSWDKLVGVFCRIDHTGTASARKISRIGHIYKERWFSME